ncbi:unnamed protein product, partial [Urochloa humidicola]
PAQQGIGGRREGSLDGERLKKELFSSLLFIDASVCVPRDTSNTRHGLRTWACPAQHTGSQAQVTTHTWVEAQVVTTGWAGTGGPAAAGSPSPSAPCSASAGSPATPCPSPSSRTSTASPRRRRRARTGTPSRCRRTRAGAVAPVASGAAADAGLGVAAGDGAGGRDVGDRAGGAGAIDAVVRARRTARRSGRVPRDGRLRCRRGRG